MSREPKITQPSEFEERMVQLKRVSKKTKGGNTMSFAALMVIGDKKGRVGTGYGKGRDVQSAIQKAIASAKRTLIEVKLKDGTISHEVTSAYGSAKVLLKPAPEGAGVIAGGSVRTVMELAGVRNVSAKMLGSNNKICNIKSALLALEKLKRVI